ncbi:MAG: TIM barrel protein [Candidatus Aenigmatarchaeota archaeon]|nr:TIM barrel protein [Candidatus Aenigmarchaeota archaeon]
MEIFLGPAGLPLSSKGTSTIDGIKRVSELKLNALELEFVQNIYLNEKYAKEVGDVAKEFGIRLSIHAPYYINLCARDKRIVEASKQRILKTAQIGEIINADAIAIHSAYYLESREKTFENLKQNFLEILDKLRESGISNVRLGIEIMGKENMFGSLDEVIQLCKEINHKQLVPYLDFGHIYVRNNGKINYREIFDKLKSLKLNHINSHFEGVKYNLKTKKFVDIHTTIDKHPPFRPLAQEILKRKLNITIISESPILEIDSLKMKSILDELRHQL